MTSELKSLQIQYLYNWAPFFEGQLALTQGWILIQVSFSFAQSISSDGVLYSF